MTTMFLTVGLPGAGKTTLARTVAAEHGALRLTPDEWMIPLFGDNDAGGKRDVLEGRLISLALQTLRLNTNVVLDFGCWSRDERRALRWFVETEGRSFRLLYVPVDPETQIERVRRRWETAPHTTFPMAEADLARWRAAFEIPNAAELTASESQVPPPPPWRDWLQWAESRWPSLSMDL